MPEHENGERKPHPDKHIDVAVLTTSGSWPRSGFDSVPSNQDVRIQLKQATKHLHITNTTGWVATVDGRELNINGSYQANGLTGSVTIDYGPSEGGGGCE